MELTEAETEYAVNVVKHIFDKHVVFQYNCTNTIPEQLLEDVSSNLKTIFSVMMPAVRVELNITNFSSCYDVLVLGHHCRGCLRSRTI